MRFATEEPRYPNNTIGDASKLSEWLFKDHALPPHIELTKSPKEIICILTRKANFENARLQTLGSSLENWLSSNISNQYGWRITLQAAAHGLTGRKCVLSAGAWLNFYSTKQAMDRFKTPTFFSLLMKFWQRVSRLNPYRASIIQQHKLCIFFR